MRGRQRGKNYLDGSNFQRELSRSKSGWESVSSVSNKLGGTSNILCELTFRNLDLEIPDGQTLEETSSATRSQWAEKLDLLNLSNPSKTPEKATILYSSLAHTLVYPYEIHEQTPTGPQYYSGYLDKVVPGTSYSGYSIWDTFRAEWGWLILIAPHRVGEMVRSMLGDYKEGGWLPMWKNLVESNIMVGTHGDVMIAQAMQAGESSSEQH
jgi:putative alpha-1,2-mannosidase